MSDGQLLALAALALVLGVVLLVWAVTCFVFVQLRLGNPLGEGWLTFLLVVAKYLHDVIADRVRSGPPVR